MQNTGWEQPKRNTGETTVSGKSNNGLGSSGREVLLDLISEYLLNELERIWFQQDDTTWHTSDEILNPWRNLFELRIIFQRAQVNWTSRSCHRIISCGAFWKKKFMIPILKHLISFELTLLSQLVQLNRMPEIMLSNILNKNVRLPSPKIRMNYSYSFTINLVTSCPKSGFSISRISVVEIRLQLLDQ